MEQVEKWRLVHLVHARSIRKVQSVAGVVVRALSNRNLFQIGVEQSES